MSATADALRAIPLFAELSEAELVSLASCVSEVSVEPGTEVIRQGERGTDFFVIVTGSLEIAVDGRTVNRLGPGEFLGELSLLLGMPRTSTAVAVGPTTLLIMNQDSFTRLLSDNPEVETKVLAVVAERLRYR